MARIISLVVLGATFYVGGLFYQRLMVARSAADPAAVAGQKPN